MGHLNRSSLREMRLLCAVKLLRMIQVSCRPFGTNSYGWRRIPWAGAHGLHHFAAPWLICFLHSWNGPR